MMAMFAPDRCTMMAMVCSVMAMVSRDRYFVMVESFSRQMFRDDSDLSRKLFHDDNGFSRRMFCGGSGLSRHVP